MKKFFNEFKDFISKGNVLDMSVGIIIGGAFTSIVTALTEGIITPLIGLLFGGIDFSGLVVQIGDTKFPVGQFVTAVINFLLVAFVLFCILKTFHALTEKAKQKLIHEKGGEPEPEPEPDPQIVLLTQIRDLLQKEEAK